MQCIIMQMIGIINYISNIRGSNWDVIFELVFFTGYEWTKERKEIFQTTFTKNGHHDKNRHG